MHFAGNKYKVDFGVIKTMSDGELVVLVNEVVHTMLIDSLSNHNVDDDNLFKTNFTDTDEATYLSVSEKNITFLNNEYKAIVAVDGTNDANGVLNEVVTFLLLDNNNTWKHWIDYNKKTSEFTWFEISQTSIDKSIQNLKIHIPTHELDTYAGYQVSDYRFFK
jgi:hypothetical protein